MSSRTLNYIVKNALQAKFHVHPIPRTLAQSTALFNYFQKLVTDANRLVPEKSRIIQFRQAKNPKTATRLNNFQILFRDVLPDDLTLEDTALVKHVSFHEHCEYIKSHLPDRDSQAEQNGPSTEELEYLYACGNLYNNVPPGLTRPPPQSSVYVSSSYAPSALERALLRTSVLAIDNTTHQPLPLGDALKFALSDSTQSDDNVTLFTLDLASLTRDPKVINHNMYMRLFAHYRLDSKQPFDERLQSLERLRYKALKGFSGEFYA